MMPRPYDPAALEQYFEPTRRFTTFAVWTQEAQNAHTALVLWFLENPDPPKKTVVPVDAEVYGAMKPSLRKYFQEKCAYCDSKFTVVDWGDVDHYRPKLRVAEAKGHRGYYWLAYDISNLLPACPVCNRGGKRDHFPVDPETRRAAGPGPLDEHPLLLRPYDLTWQEVQRCFEYDFHVGQGRYGRELLPTGAIKGLSPEGEKTIEVFDLNRASLKDARRESQKAAIQRLENAFKESMLDEVLEDLFSSAQQHASAVRATCVRFFEFRRQIQDEKLRKLGS
jgi:hypothetical protein